MPLLAACGGGTTTEGSLGIRGEVAPVANRVAAPQLAGPRVDGGSWDLAALRGKVVVVNAFGSWCVPCQQETPALQAAHAATQDKGVEFLGLGERHTLPKLREFMQRYGVTYPAVLDTDGSIIARLRQLPVSAVPSTLVVDRQGRVAARWVGPVLGSQLRQVLDTLAAEPA